MVLTMEQVTELLKGVKEMMDAGRNGGRPRRKEGRKES
jgi:hypothetical protein